MGEIQDISNKLIQKYGQVGTLNRNTIATGLYEFIGYIQTTPLLKSAAERLFSIQNAPSIGELLAGRFRMSPPVERSKKAKLCYEILRNYYDQEGEKDQDLSDEIAHIGFRLSGQKDMDESARFFVGILFDPLFQYLEEELEELEVRVSDEKVKDEEVAEPNPANRRRVFIVHGRDMGKLYSLLSFLTKHVEPIIFDDALRLMKTPSPSIINVIDTAMRESQAIVVLMTPDDVARLDSEPQSELRGQARPNVIFEAGIALGRYRSRTVLVEYGETSMLSDLHGFYVVRLSDKDGEIEGLDKILAQLKVAGCEFY